MAIPLNFTKRKIEALPYPESGRVEYRDFGGPQSEKSLYLRVGSSTKTYYIVKHGAGKTVRSRIGDATLIPVHEARKRAKSGSTEIVAGIDPNAELKELRQRGLTLDQIFEQYIEAAQSRAKKPLRRTTAANYRRMKEVHFSAGKHQKRKGGRDYDKPGKGWLSKPAKDITNEMAVRWYEKASRYSVSSANAAVRAAKAAYSHQIVVSEKQGNALFTNNPFSNISLIAEKPAKDYIEPQELPAWFAAVDTLANPVTRDYLKLVLLTGLRRREAASLTWDQIDLQRKRTLTLSAEQSKNGEMLVLPLSDYLLELLAERRARTDSIYVFPGKNGHLQEPKKSIQSVNSRAKTYSTIHGLRRTYSNICLWHVGIPEYARKQLLNHSIGKDITQKHYTIDAPLDQLRMYQQRITEKILEMARIDHSTKKIHVLKVTK